MTKELKGSQTEKNLWTAFAGESQARNKYTFFAQQAKKEGYEQMMGIFLETADHEMAHAKRIFRFLNGIGDTKKNLEVAKEGENYEWTEMYRSFEVVAREEGFEEIAEFFHEVAEVEEEHEKRFQKLLDNLSDGSVFKKESEVEWQCRNCGYVHTGLEAPELCPSCVHPKAHFQIYCKNY
ncbi:rubrerythrin [Desulfuribacillus alkaliarsenatis]|uniref:Rubrerythrin n=1 Tax=Desulfuribacillus alkaliarsenatis TaxID=766136 RepID=A0A1E5G107_9FIRM|nr:rubrerythrin family protein [Desulfuribacillus alkaliarsenatis]OEF96500.1 rubrerythrin [Desulfuribacillus alkaliarsenatis]